MKKTNRFFVALTSMAMAAALLAPSSVFAADTFKIGGIGPTTGGAAAYGIAVRNGAEVAVQEINEAGGINGYQIEFRMEDDVHDAEKSVYAYNTLKDWGMQLLLGTVTSDPCIAVASYAVEDNMFLLTPSGSAVDCVAEDNAFRVCFSDPDQGAKSAEYIGTHDIATKVAILYKGDDPYSTGITESFVGEAPNQGLEIVASDAFIGENTDFKVQLQKAKDAGAELVFLPIYYGPASLILQQAKEIDYSPIFFGCDGLDGILGIENFDTSLAEGVMLLTPFTANAEDEATVHFVEAYEAAFNGLIPIQFAADAYDGIYAMKAALESFGATPDMDASELCDQMKTAMTEITVDGLTGSITWEATGEPTKEPKAVIITNGEYEPM